VNFDAVIERHGLTAWGVAETALILDSAQGEGRALLEKYPRAISLLARLSAAVVDGLEGTADGRKRAPVLNYWHHMYQVVNPALDAAAREVTRLLEAAGYRAYPIPASQTIDATELRGYLSHKAVARQAGLGWIGRSCLLVTPQHGPRVRLATVLTDAPLEASRPLDRDCGSCRVCVEACPAGAFTGRPWRADELREERFDVWACHQHTERRKEAWGFKGDGTICGICVWCCPYGRCDQSFFSSPGGIPGAV